MTFNSDFAPVGRAKRGGGPRTKRQRRLQAERLLPDWKPKVKHRKRKEKEPEI